MFKERESRGGSYVVKTIPDERWRSGLSMSKQHLVSLRKILPISSVPFSRSVMSDSVTPWTSAHQASLSITNFQSLPKPMSIELVIPSSHLIVCHPLLLLLSIPPSIRVFSNESALQIRCPKYWSFSFNISPSSEHPGLRLVGSPCSPRDSQESSPTPQFKRSILWCSVFFTVQLSHPYMTTGKTIALTRWTFNVWSFVTIFFHLTETLQNSSIS